MKKTTQKSVDRINQIIMLTFAIVVILTYMISIAEADQRPPVNTSGLDCITVEGGYGMDLITATCPSGYDLTGGGCLFGFNYVEEHQGEEGYTGSYPDTDRDAWYCIDQYRPATAFARCCRVE